MNELYFVVWTLFVVGTVILGFKMGKVALYGIIGAYIILANIFVLKQITLFGLAATGGNALYGAIFLATDLLSEYWGKKEARKAVLFGWLCAFGFLIATQVFLLFQPSVDDFAHDSMKTLFSITPRIILGSLIAYGISQMHDVWAFHFWKDKFEGRHLWLRNNASTWVSQLIDSAIFSFVAFLGVFPLAVVIQIAISTYLLKIIVAAIDTPFLYLSRKMKPAELKS